MTTSMYEPISIRALATITRKGALIVFLADAWTGGSIAAATSGRAIEIPGDPDEYRALGLVESNPVTVIVAANGLSITPKPGTRFTWVAKTYTVKTAVPVGPDGQPIIWTLVGAT